MHHFFNRFLKITPVFLSLFILSHVAYAEIRLEYTQDKQLVEAFYNTVVVPVFPNADELDPIEEWLKTCTDANEDDWTTQSWARRFLLAVDYADSEAPTAVAGVVIETFDANQTALLAYAATAKSHQGKGLYKQLIQKAVQDHPVLFLETEATSAPVLENEPMDRSARHMVHNKAGFTRLPITYVQPPCSEGQEAVPNMHLLMYAHAGQTVATSTVRRFMQSFYGQYDAINTDYYRVIAGELDAAGESVVTTGLPW